MYLLGIALAHQVDGDTAMVDDIPLGALTDGIGVVAVVLFIGVLVMAGRLIPRRTYDDALHDRDMWRAKSMIQDQQIAEKDTQLRHLAEVGRTVEQIMGAITRADEARAYERRGL